MISPKSSAADFNPPTDSAFLRTSEYTVVGVEKDGDLEMGMSPHHRLWGSQAL